MCIMSPFIGIGYTVPITYDCAALTLLSPSSWHLMTFQVRTSIVMVSSRGKSGSRHLESLVLFTFVLLSVGLFSKT